MFNPFWFHFSLKVDIWTSFQEHRLSIKSWSQLFLQFLQTQYRLVEDPLLLVQRSTWYLYSLSFLLNNLRLISIIAFLSILQILLVIVSFLPWPFKTISLLLDFKLSSRCITGDLFCKAGVPSLQRDVLWILCIRFASQGHIESTSVSNLDRLMILWYLLVVDNYLPLFFPKVQTSSLI